MLGRLADMSPALSIDNFANALLWQAEHVAYFGLRKSSGVKLPYFTNLVFCKLVIVMLFSMRVSHFCKHVFVVVVASANKKMVDIYAPRIVALVKNKQSIWNRPVVPNPRYAMGQDSLSSAVVGVKHSITAVVNIAVEIYASVGVWLVAIPQKTLLNRCFNPLRVAFPIAKAVFIFLGPGIKVVKEFTLAMRANILKFFRILHCDLAFECY